MKKVNYDFDIKIDNEDKLKGLKLCEELKITENILIYFFRTRFDYIEIFKKYREHLNITILEDIKNSDRFCVFIPKIYTYSDLTPLILQTDIQTEITLIPIRTDLNNILFNWEIIKKSNAVKYNLADCEFEFGQDSDLTIFFSDKFYDNNIQNIATWEKNIADIKFKKKIKNLC